MRFRKPTIAALAAGAAATPVGLALAAEPAPPARTVSPALRVSLAGDQSTAETLREAGAGRHVDTYVALSRRRADLTGRRFARAAALRQAHDMSPRGLRRANRALRAEVRELDVPIPPVMWKIAECESHGDPRAIGGDGTFRGALQFMRSTWESVGGQGDPAAAPMEEQLRRGAILMTRSGASPWPVCGA